MKHILLICLFVVNGSIFHATAQDSTTAVKKTPQEKLKAQSQKLNEQFNLTVQQQVSVDSINKIFMQQAVALRTSDEKRMGKMKALRKAQEDKNAAMKTVLDEKQYAQYEQQQDEQKEKLKEHMGKRRKG